MTQMSLEEQRLAHPFPQMTVKDLIKRLKTIDDKTMIVNVSVHVGDGVHQERPARFVHTDSRMGGTVTVS